MTAVVVSTGKASASVSPDIPAAQPQAAGGAIAPDPAPPPVQASSARAVASTSAAPAAPAAPAASGATGTGAAPAGRLPPVQAPLLGPQAAAAVDVLNELRERTARLERRDTERDTDRLLREARAYAGRRGRSFEPATMAALLKALAEAAGSSGHPDARKWRFSAIAYEAQLEECAADADFRELAIKFIGDAEQAAVADVTGKWKKSQGIAKKVAPPPTPPPQKKFHEGARPFSGATQDQCRGCHGYGHWLRDCPSNRRQAPRGRSYQPYQPYQPRAGRRGRY
uniref:CCHC-type domain-containing protein n=1 Tax=Branchiostoma floridae TaxID=7739 RepID=C3ZGD8_BRAFL|eukprot:XP_002592371.1 hypothetical protein BRAFLDRAFT_106231 [Branchiostoma floridae]